jgi:hypothetical protein
MMLYHEVKPVAGRFDPIFLIYSIHRFVVQGYRGAACCTPTKKLRKSDIFPKRYITEKFHNVRITGEIKNWR